jgi:hypothetical protein
MIKALMNETAEEAVPLISGKTFIDALKITGWQIAQLIEKIIIDSVIPILIVVQSNRIHSRVV